MTPVDRYQESFVGWLVGTIAIAAVLQVPYAMFFVMAVYLAALIHRPRGTVRLTIRLVESLLIALPIVFAVSGISSANIDAMVAFGLLGIVMVVRLFQVVLHMDNGLTPDTFLESCRHKDWFLEIVPAYNARNLGLIEHLRERGHAVAAISTARCWLPSEMLKKNVHLMASSERPGHYTVPFANISLPQHVRLVLGLPRTIIMALRMVGTIRRAPSAVIGYNAGIQGGGVAFVIAKLLRVPFILDHADLEALGYKHRGLQHWIEAMLVRHSDGISVLSERWGNVVSRWFKKPSERIRVIRSASNPSIAQARTFDAADARRRLGIEPGQFVLGYSGNRWNVRTRTGQELEIQGVDEVLDGVLAFAEAHRGAVTLVMAGAPLVAPPEWRDRARAAGLVVKEVGSYSYGGERHLDTLAASDVLLMGGIPVSVFRFFDRFKLYEYAMAGRPILSSDLTPVRESGLPSIVYFQSGDRASIVRALESLYQSHEDLRSRAVAVDTYALTWERRSEDFADLIEAVSRR